MKLAEQDAVRAQHVAELGAVVGNSGARASARTMWLARFATPRAGELHLRPFLLSSAVCDCDHPAVVALSLELVGRCTSVAEAAASVRAWVREHILYTLQDKSDRASQTLAKREGMCTNKANLQVALLRAAGIPGMPHTGLQPRD
jgi:transglutaminase-like putative cysteine protease